jgi:hypothetical protein
MIIHSRVVTSIMNDHSNESHIKGKTPFSPWVRMKNIILLSRMSLEAAILLPESFRGGCSFGAKTFLVK